MKSTIKIEIPVVDALSFIKYMAKKESNNMFIPGLRVEDFKYLSKKYPQVDIPEIIKEHLHRLYIKQLVEDGIISELEYLEMELNNEI